MKKIGERLVITLRTVQLSARSAERFHVSDFPETSTSGTVRRNATRAGTENPRLPKNPISLPVWRLAPSMRKPRITTMPSERDHDGAEKRYRVSRSIPTSGLDSIRQRLRGRVRSGPPRHRVPAQPLSYLTPPFLQDRRRLSDSGPASGPSRAGSSACPSSRRRRTPSPLPPGSSPAGRTPA